MKIKELTESFQLDQVANMIDCIELHYSKLLNRTVNLKLNPDKLSSMDQSTAIETTRAAVTLMVGDSYGVNHAESISQYVTHLISQLSN